MNNYQQQTSVDLNPLNFELAEIYFPIFCLQINYSTIARRNRLFKNNEVMQQQAQNVTMRNANEENEDDLFQFEEQMKSQFENQCKTFFVLRDFYLLRLVQITGTIVFLIKKDDKYFFGSKQSIFYLFY